MQTLAAQRLAATLADACEFPLSVGDQSGIEAIAASAEDEGDLLTLRILDADQDIRGDLLRSDELIEGIGDMGKILFDAPVRHVQDRKPHFALRISRRQPHIDHTLFPDLFRVNVEAFVGRNGIGNNPLPGNASGKEKDSKEENIASFHGGEVTP